MNDKDNYLKNAELYLEQGGGLIDGVLNNLPLVPVPEPGRAPLEKVKEPPCKRRSRDREER